MAAPVPAGAGGDASSFAKPGEVVVRHSHFELDVNFEERVIHGYAHLHVEGVAPAVEGGAGATLTLDTRDLAVHAVEALPGGGALAHAWGEPHKALGRALHVTLPPGFGPGSALVVGVRFSTSPSSTAVQWLDPSMTAGGTQPYLFTQCQAIHARSLLPCQARGAPGGAAPPPARALTRRRRRRRRRRGRARAAQDTPSVKSTYSADVRVPAGLTALMSATPTDGDPPRPGGGSGGGGDAPGAPARLPPRDGAARFFFSQAVPIPSYLIALAVGELESRELSDRSRVWSEPSVVDAAAYEFAETAKFLDAAEALAGRYVWGRYDLLLLPPSFPYGGMENPCLTFVTPTLIAGDRSLTNVVAHEIAHSWTGNLVTNAAWSDFWLNEGWTVFLERKILGALHGEAARQFAASRGAASLAEEVSRIGHDHNFTRLVPDLSHGADPDDAFSRVPYEKGFWFLYWLESLVGGPAAFDPYMRAYLASFAGGTVTSDAFRRHFCDHFAAVPEVAGIDWDAWLHAPGMPPEANTYDTSLAAAAEALAVRWHTADVLGVGAPPPPGAGPADIAGWGTEQVLAFLERLAELRSMTPLAPALCRAADAAYGFDAATNAEIRAAWYKVRPALPRAARTAAAAAGRPLPPGRRAGRSSRAPRAGAPPQLCIAAGDEAVFPGVRAFLTEQGRMKYLRPLYRALLRSRSAAGPALARDTFAAAAPRYHPIARKMVEADLGL
ncbi:lkhA [Scenedesmus sp. PABB004]|nr:lkhA [Scenedesmus sp. PABB004]